MKIPTNLLYSNDHEWISINGEIATIGITDFAQDALGDITYVELPALDTIVAVGDTIGTVESVKSASDIYAPISGTIVEVNTDLSDAPEKINSEAYEGGWICKLKLDSSDFSNLLSAEKYAEIAK